MALVGAGFGMFQRLDRQRQLVARIEAAGGHCDYDTKPPSSRSYVDKCFRRWLPQSYFDPVCSVVFGLDGPNAEELDEILVHVSELKSLESIGLWHAPVTDESIAQLVAIKLLSALSLDDTLIGDKGLSHLAELKSLGSISLTNTRVTDAGLRHLAEMKSLWSLHLQYTQVSDAGISHLTELKSLRYLYLNHTQVSAVGIQQLKTALPNCKIVVPK